MPKALFLDRDGILNRVIMRDQIPSSPRSLEEFVLIEEALDFTLLAKKKGFLNVVITNQPDVSRGLLSKKDLVAMHHLLQTSFPIDHIEVCTSQNDAYFRRKPNPGMLLESAAKYNISLKDSFFLGDSLKDLQAGKRAQVVTLLLQTDYNRFIHGLGHLNCSSWKELTRWLEKL